MHNLTDEVPEWARELACKLVNDEVGYPYVSPHRLLGPFGKAFARYITAHEPAPVDPLDEQAMEAAFVEAARGMAEALAWYADTDHKAAAALTAFRQAKGEA